MKRKMEKEATTGSEQLGARSRGSEQQRRRREEEVRGRRGHDDRSSRGEGKRKRKMGKKALTSRNLTQPIAAVRNDDI